MNSLLNVNSSPHIKDETTTRKIMLDVIVSLLPVSIFGVLQFGINSLMIIIATIFACIISETIFNMVMHKKNTVSDLSCVVTGLILALNMPPTIEIYIPIIGAVFAIIVVKMLFGGLGQNFMNPALAGRCFLVISFTSQMTKFVYDGVSSATPLLIEKNSLSNQFSLFDIFIGRVPGTIGEVSILLLLIGALYLVIKKVIDIKIPLIYIFTVLIFTIIFSGRGFDINYLFIEIFSGGLVFGAFYMATDYVTSPVTDLGKIIYAIILGLLTGIFRIFGKSAEGVSYAIIISNILVPFIETKTIPKAFGKE